MPRTFRLGLVALPVLALACSSGDVASDSSELRDLTKEEALGELDQVGAAIKGLYGPLEFKKARTGFDIDRALASARAEIQNGNGEADFVRPFYELLAQLHDGHVSFNYALRGDSTTKSMVPVLFSPMENKYVVTALEDGVKGIEKGDALVSIDGVSVKRLEELLSPLEGSGTPEGTRQMVGYLMTYRPFYAPSELKPAKGASAHIVLQKAGVQKGDGEYAVDLPWKQYQGLANMITPPVEPAANASTTLSAVAFSTRAAEVIAASANPKANIFQYGDKSPFFMTREVRAALGIVDVAPKAETLKSVGVTMPADAETAAKFISLSAYKYRYQGKTVLLVRIPAFTTAMNNYGDQIAWLSALLIDNMHAPTAQSAQTTLADAPADAVVVDDTHNPGGAVPYVGGLARLFIGKAIPGFVQANHADRIWISKLLDYTNGADAATQPILKNRLLALEAAYDQGKWLAPPVPLTGVFEGPTVKPTPESDVGSETITPYPLVHWNKSLLILTDELSVSGGDAFPMVLKNGGVAKTFGARTGGLGGSVEQVLTLPSGNELRLTRGIFGTLDSSGTLHTIENDGVAPDYPYQHTVADFRAGYVGYVKSFSDVVVKLP